MRLPQCQVLKALGTRFTTTLVSCLACLPHFRSNPGPCSLLGWPAAVHFINTTFSGQVGPLAYQDGPSLRSCAVFLQIDEKDRLLSPMSCFYRPWYDGFILFSLIYRLLLSQHLSDMMTHDGSGYLQQAPCSSGCGVPTITKERLALRKIAQDLARPGESSLA